MEEKRKNVNARGGRISTGPANQTLDSPQPLTQGSGTPSDVRPRTDKKKIKKAALSDHFFGLIRSWGG